MTTAKTSQIQDTFNAQFIQAIREHYMAGYQILYVPSVEEARVEQHIEKVGEMLDVPVITWDVARGFTRDGRQMQDFKDPIYRAPGKALDIACSSSGEIKPITYNGAPDTHAEDNNSNAIVVIRDSDDFTNDPTIRRRLKNIFESKLMVNCDIKHHRILIIISAVTDVHIKLRSVTTMIEFPMPTEAQLRQTVKVVGASTTVPVPLSEEFEQKLALALMGLTDAEAENCLSRCLVRYRGFDEKMLDMIREEKAAIVKRTEILTYIPETQGNASTAIGGYDEYMGWLRQRALAYSPEARQLQIDPPRGVVLAGVPGSGKSMIAKATCRVLGLPGYILDVGSLFGSKVGESEQRTREVLRQIDAQNGCVLVIDEADKALGNAHESVGDSGVTRRIFGSLLTWLAENKSRTFVIVTLNRTKGLPPEFFRAGRFDQIWFVDTPNDIERQQIFDIHFRLRGVEPASLKFSDSEWQQLIASTKDYVGAEIEEIIRNARYKSFHERKSGLPTFDDVMSVISTFKCMAQRCPDELAEIRNFCQDFARNVSSPTISQPKAQRAARRINTPNN